MREVGAVETVIPKIVVQYLEGGKILRCGGMARHDFGDRQTQHRLAQRVLLEAVLKVANGAHGKDHLLAAQRILHEAVETLHDLLHPEAAARKKVRGTLFAVCHHFPVLLVDPRRAESYEHVIGFSKFRPSDFQEVGD